MSNDESVKKYELLVKKCLEKSDKFQNYSKDRVLYVRYHTQL